MLQKRTSLLKTKLFRGFPVAKEFEGDTCQNTGIWLDESWWPPTLSEIITKLEAILYNQVFHCGLSCQLAKMDYEELFPEISPMDEILESDFTSNVCSSNWSQSHSLGDLVCDDMENLFLQTRLNLDGFDSASTISSEPSSPQNFKGCGEFLTDDDLMKLSIRDLNRRLKTLPKAEAYKIRKRRRSLKNRSYATSCRQRRTELKENLEIQNQRLKVQLREAKESLYTAVKDRDMYKQKFEQLSKVFSGYTQTASSWGNNIYKCEC